MNTVEKNSTESRLGDPSLSSSPPRIYALRENTQRAATQTHEGESVARASLDAQKERRVLRIALGPQHRPC